MSYADIAGYTACSLVFATFCMSSMVALRLTAVCSNVAFILYASVSDLAPILILHCALLPINIRRLAEIPETRMHFQRVLSILGLQSGDFTQRTLILLLTITAMLGLSMTSPAAGQPCSETTAAKGSDIPVVLHAARCAPDLLRCSDVSVRAPEFRDMEKCEYFLAGFRANATMTGESRSDHMMLRCRYAPWVARRPGDRVTRK